MHYNVNDNKPYSHKYFWPVISLKRYRQESDGWFYIRTTQRRNTKSLLVGSISRN